MKKLYFLFIISLIGFVNFSYSQNLLATGISSETDIRNIITNSGFTIQDENFDNINSTTLAGKEVLALFYGGQTWDGNQLFTTSQADDIINFVQNGGYLYITARKGYDNVLSQLGITASGNDGSSSGFDWPLTELTATTFSTHQITENLSSIVGDVGASFTVDVNWSVIGEESNGTDLLAVRSFGSGKVVLWYGQRSFRNAGSTGNVYETDITEGSNTQYHINLFNYFANTSAVQYLSNSDINIFPNPTKSSITISYANNDKFNLSIFNTLGQSVFSEDAIINSKSINISEFNKGIYFLIISDLKGNKLLTKKIIKE